MQSANQILLSNETNMCAYFNIWEIEVHGGEKSKRRMQKNLPLRYKNSQVFFLPLHWFFTFFSTIDFYFSN